MATANRFVCVTTTMNSEAKAKALARQIVAARLAACVQYFPIHSIYRWKDRVESAAEHLLLAKTRKALAPELAAFIRQHHDYETPEITITPIAGGLSAYLNWIASETKAAQKSSSSHHDGG